MIRRLWRSLWACFSCVLLSFAFSLDACALAPELVDSFERELKAIAALNAPFVLGGKDVQKGLDCSNYIRIAAVRAGIPGVGKLATARDIMAGYAGWYGHDMFVRVDSKRGDIWGWDWSGGGQDIGHIGVYVPKAKRPGVYHASKSRGVTHTEIKEGSKLDICLARIRRLTIGDPQ